MPNEEVLVEEQPIIVEGEYVSPEQFEANRLARLQATEQQKPTVATGEEPKTQVAEQPKPSEAKVVDLNEKVKEWGFESIEKAEAEIKRLKEATAKPEHKFENEVSEKLFKMLQEGKQDDVYAILNEQKKIDKVLSYEIKDANEAAEIIKLQMRSKYKDLTDEEIEFKFKKDFNIPKEPTQRADELDEEFEERKAEWEQRKNDVETQMRIEAKLAKPEIQKLKTEIKLPNLSDGVSQEELEARQEKARELYIKTLDAEYKSFDGFKVTAKSEDAELPVAYNVSDEEKAALKERLSDFDPTEYVFSRWFNQDGVPKVQQIMKDIYQLENGDKVLQKVANDAASQMHIHRLRVNSNLNLNGQQGVYEPQNMTEQEKQIHQVLSI